MYFAKNALDRVWLIDLALSLILFIVFAFGLSPTLTFANLMILQVPHIFLFAWYRAVIGGPVDKLPDSGVTSTVFISGLYGLLLLDLALVSVGAIWRTVELISVGDTLSTFEIVSGGILTAFVYALLVLDIIGIGFLTLYRQGVDAYHRIRLHVGARLGAAYEEWRSREGDEDAKLLGTVLNAQQPKKARVSDIGE